MVESVGVVDGRLLLFAQPKKWFLAFDRLAVTHFDTTFSQARAIFKDPHALNDIQWLAEEGHLYMPDTDSATLIARFRESPMVNDPKWFQFVQHVQATNNNFDRDAFRQVLKSGTPEEKREAMGNWLIWQHTAGSLGSQIWAPLLADEKTYTIPIVGDILPVPTPKEGERDTCMRVVLSELPLPDDSTPWQDLVAFRNDSDTRLKYLELRQWVNSVADGECSAREVADQMEYLIAAFEDHMKRSRLMHTKGALEWSLPIALDVCKGRLSQAATGLFSRKYSRLKIQQAERDAPGRQLAFVVKANKRFGR